MRLQGFCLSAAAVVLGLVCGAARGQGGLGGTIPYDLVGATEALSPEQQRVIDRYQDPRVAALLSGDAERLGEARRQLIEPLTRAGASDVFLRSYSSALAGRLGEAVSSQDLVVRLNTAIVVAHLRDGSALELVRAGVVDPSPAVRYWAAKAAGRCASGGRLAREDEAGLLAELSGVLGRESSRQVRQAALLALVSFDEPSASELLLENLNRDVGAVGAGSVGEVETAVEALRALFVRVVENRSKGVEVSDELIRRLAQVAYRHLAWSAGLLDEGRAEGNAAEAHVRMVDVASKVLPWSVKQLSPGSAQPGGMADELGRRDWAAVLERVAEWKRVLVSPGVGLGEDALLVVGM